MEGSSAIVQLDSIPHELVTRILMGLGPQELANAAQVCRSWRQMVDQEELWHSLFVRSFGEEAPRESSKSWKSAFAIRKRRDDFGTEAKIVREGEFYSVVQDGHVVRSLGKRKRAMGEPPSRNREPANVDAAVDGSPTPPEAAQQRRCHLADSALDLILFFLGDLERAKSANKINSMTRVG